MSIQDDNAANDYAKELESHIKILLGISQALVRTFEVDADATMVSVGYPGELTKPISMSEYFRSVAVIVGGAPVITEKGEAHG